MVRGTWEVGVSAASSVYHADPDMFDAQPMRAGCLLCGWTFEGTAAAGRESFREHRVARHPETLRASMARVRRIEKADLVTVCTRSGCGRPPLGEGSFPSLCLEHADEAWENRQARRSGWV